MSNPEDTRSCISFTFDYEGQGWAHASIADNAASYQMEPSYVLVDPLFGLLQAVVEIIRIGDGDTGCEWWYEPTLDRWRLHQDGDLLRITIRQRRDGTPAPAP